MTPEMVIPVDEFEALHDRIRKLEAEVERMGGALGRHHVAMPAGDLDPCVICEGWEEIEQ